MEYREAGTTIYYEFAGNADSPDPPLLLLHGAFGSMHEMDGIARSFEDRKQLFLDLPPHGRSRTELENITTRALAEVIHRFLISEEIPSVDIIGYSLGGYVGIELALQSPAHVRSIISHAMKFYWSQEEIEKATSAMSWNLVRENEKRRAKLEAMHPASGAERVFQMNAGLIRSFGKRQLSLGDLNTASAPLLLSVGDRDELVPLGEVLSLFNGLDQATTALAIHPNTRHRISALSPQSFERAARQFWTKMIPSE